MNFFNLEVGAFTKQSVISEWNSRFSLKVELLLRSSKSKVVLDLKASPRRLNSAAVAWFRASLVRMSFCKVLFLASPRKMA